nr:lipoate--protein ligase family protein [Candidatus Omnitrophota bacterium]
GIKENSMPPSWRIIQTGAADAFTNMAVDEAILRGYRCGFSPPTLRIYSWKSPSLTLGYSQDAGSALDVEFCRSNSVPFVRRITGGGVILHDREITYSLVCSKGDLGLTDGVECSYKAIASFLVSFYKRLGLDAMFACDYFKETQLGLPSALCFAAKEKYDILVGGKKIGGSAQKRSKDLIFQHGSIPIRLDMERANAFTRSKDNIASLEGATCLEELLGSNIGVACASNILAKSFADSFGLEIFGSVLYEAEDIIAMNLRALKYESPEWNFERIDKTASCARQESDGC